MKLLAALLGMILFTLNSSAQSGCTDPTACNFDISAVSDDGSCVFESWNSLGNMGVLGLATAFFNDLSFDVCPLTQDIYCAYKGSDLLPHVIRYSGCEWELVGNQGLIDDFVAYFVRITVHPVNGKPYIYFTESNSHYLRVKVYEDNEWKDVGPTDFANNLVQPWNMIIHPISGEPYLMFRDHDGASAIGFTVMKFSNDVWSIVGSSSFTGSDLGAWADMNIHPVSGEPYVAYKLNQAPYLISVQKFNGTTWDFVGAQDFGGDNGTWINIDFDPSDGNPIVAYEDFTNDLVVIKKYNGSDWQNLGNPISASTVDRVCLTIDPVSQNPRISFVASQPFPLITSTEIQSFDGVDWQLEEILPNTIGQSVFNHFYHPATNELLLGTFVGGYTNVYSKNCGIICDSDFDGISDEDEFAAGTNPYNSDSDGDGLTDGMEIEVSLTDPSNPDTDGDGCNDYLEWGHLCPDSIPCELDNCPGDLNGDDIVNVGDLAIMLSAFGINCVE